MPMAARIRHPCHVDTAKYYERLVRDLDGWTSASQPAPGRIRVEVPQAGRGEWVIHDRHGVERRIGDYPEGSSRH